MIRRSFFLTMPNIKLLSSPALIVCLNYSQRFNNSPSSSSGSSWTYEEVDKEGKTRLDKLYEDTAFRVQQQFQQPIQIYQGGEKKLNQESDGKHDETANESSTFSSSKECDFLIGFSQYKYSMRNSYRNTIAFALNSLPSFTEGWRGEITSQSESELVGDAKKDSAPSSFQFNESNIELTVAWTGRFAEHRFRGCHKVIGVSLVKRQNLGETNKEEDDDDANKSKDKKVLDWGMKPQARKIPFDDTPLKRNVIMELVSEINKQRLKGFLQIGITRAVPRDVLILKNNNNENGASSNNNNKNNSHQFFKGAVEDASIFENASNLVLREVRRLSKRHRVLVFYNNLSEKATFEKLQPIIFKAQVAPMMINIDSFLPATDQNDNSAETATNNSENNFPECLSDFPIQLRAESGGGERLFEPLEKRRIILHALADEFFKSSKESQGNENSESASADDAERSENTEKSSASGKKAATMRFPMIFINGTFFGTGAHLLKMHSTGGLRLATFIHRPSDVRYKEPNKRTKVW